jgi:hypothetical protein
MYPVHEINYHSDNDKISSVTNEGKINISILDNNTVFEYVNGERKNKIIIVHFKYKSKIVSQAFYECSGEFKGTWLPCDGIKANLDDNNVFYQYIDTEPFKNDLYPFGDERLMAVSYILGGGVWCNRNTKYRNMLKVDDRIAYVSNFECKKVEFNNSMYINHYINYAISRNYYDKHPNTSFRPKSPKWISSRSETKNEQHLFSAFDFSAKMNNSYQIEYTPPVIEGKTKREDYNYFYAKMDNAIVKTPNESYKMCIIL